ncbi:M15 family metallopeptidase [Oceanisphaera pacifica]|uniref:M15 family metallopeptidase n=1 Tax=Oceanisphaera pacifica TaxID=2818389 RepID=A0ABS3NEL5_9GAMM|nr:M15 family metallopeptidase [Oceanisphaera pacifica]MBO1519028.1 M15 family metallopeptidase [Oceanisphaera pacifica]
MDPLCLVGLKDNHLVPLAEPGHRLQAEAKQAFMAMQAAAALDGFQLMPASSFRSFERQLAIWNGKFDGTRPLLDAHSLPLNSQELSEAERVNAILRWSALPGTSRHHWGTDIDIYDPSLLPPGANLKLEPWEYEKEGYFYPLSQWLANNMARFDFYLPFAQPNGGVAVEPWHLSYRPLSAPCAAQLSPQLIAQVLKEQQIDGKTHILNQLDRIFVHYIKED